MKCYIFSMLFLLLAVESESSVDNGFFITAPGVFRVGVKEKVYVQMGKSHLNQVISLYLVYEREGAIVSEKKTVECKAEGQIEEVELTINKDFTFPEGRNYLQLVAESPTFRPRNKRSTRVWVTKHRGYIFIQTDQPIYNPTQTVSYRVFTLDHTFRPHQEPIQISIINAAGNRVMHSLRSAKGGIFKSSFPIPDVSKTGTWKITAHYEHDEANAASREFKVQKFVMPSFEVNIGMVQSYILLNDEQFDFTISAMYSYGEQVKGAYHCQFGVVKTTEGQKVTPTFIKGLELTGSVEDETTAASLQIADLKENLRRQLNQTLDSMQQSRLQLYMRVYVTNVQSGEIQEAEAHLPIISHKYKIDLSRIRSHFLPGYPLDVPVIVSLPDGSPAAGVQVRVNVSPSSDGSRPGTTNQEGAVCPVFNVATVDQITVEVSIDGLEQRKVIHRASSQSGSYLYLSFTNRVYSVGESVSVNFNTINSPNTGFLYYMVMSRGILIQKQFLSLGTTLKRDIQITADMVPSFRLIGYYYNQQGDIIADSIWVDVKDECEIKVEVESKGQVQPGKRTDLKLNLHGQSARVALLAVDKAIYALKTDNKLTGKQVFSYMESHDLGCPYGGGSNSESVLTNAGLAFVSQSQSAWKTSLGCPSQPSRQRRSVDLHQEMMTLRSNFSDEKLQECCVQGFSVIPMRRTCEERVRRVSQVETDSSCAEVFLNCCREGERLRQKKIREDAKEELGRTASTNDIELFFLDTAAQYLRRFFPPSFSFTEINVNGNARHSLTLPDSITTWEIQAVTLSAATGFCVVKPSEIKAFKSVFVSLRLPYSVKKYEQISISPVIYNYGDDTLQVAVHMEQTDGLCSPGSATTTAFVNITLAPKSSQFVSFSAVPMVTGSVPIKIRLYDIENEEGIDAIEKPLNVMTEGLEKREEKTYVLNFKKRSTETLTIDGTLPHDTVPDSNNNVFVSVEGNGFGSSHVKNLLSPQKVAQLIVLPYGCLEQTMVRLVPTALALRYLDLSDQWFDLPPGSRDDALDQIEKGFIRILTFKKPRGFYGPWYTVPSSHWVNGLVVKVLSLVAERQTRTFGQQSRKTIVSEDEIRQPVSYLLSVQKDDGSFADPNPVLHRGVLKGEDQNAAMTAFISLALQRSLQFLTRELRSNAEASISRSTTYLMSHLEELQHPYAVAVTACCLSACMPEGTDLSSVWTRLESLATKADNGCYLWTTNTSPENQARADAITIETTAYALLTAVKLGHKKWADETACWLTTQENYFGGYRTTQDTIMTLEALAEYELMRRETSETNVIAEFTVAGRREVMKLELVNKKDRVETDLKKFTGNNINVNLRGKGETKLKVVKTYYLLDSEDKCDKVSISVTVEGKVKYTATVVENYEYYDDYSNDDSKAPRVPRSAIEWFDARTRNRRALDNDVNPETVTYRVCVGHNPNSNLTGMAIADITLLSGFEAVTTDLDMLKLEPEQYISHYEVTYGRVLIYFNELFQSEECISFDAIQRVPIGLLQPAPAVFYDYYEPDTKCTVFYSAPQRSKMVSKLCSEDVCQCAERPCHTIQNTFKSVRGKKITKNQRLQHACFFPTVDYAYIAEVVGISKKSNFDMYSMNVKEVLKSHGDIQVNENSVRTFAKRHQCKGHLDLGQQYLVMGKDGATTDTNGEMQYLLESNTWVEKMPSPEDCKKSRHSAACAELSSFTDEYKIDGCRQ